MQGMQLLLSIMRRFRQDVQGFYCYMLTPCVEYLHLCKMLTLFLSRKRLIDEEDRTKDRLWH